MFIILKMLDFRTKSNDNPMERKINNKRNYSLSSRKYVSQTRKGNY